MSVIDKYANSESHKLDASSFRKRMLKRFRKVQASQTKVRVEAARVKP